MKHIILIVTLLTIAFSARSIAGGKPSRGWWIREQGHVQRLIEIKVTALILWTEIPLNHDKDAEYWIEVVLGNPPDPSAEYMLATDDHWIGIRTVGNKWTMRFNTIKSARESFEYLRNYYKLDSEHARDTTKT